MFADSEDSNPICHRHGRCNMEGSPQLDIFCRHLSAIVALLVVWTHYYQTGNCKAIVISEQIGGQ